jgi:hypothetical protein
MKFEAIFISPGLTSAGSSVAENEAKRDADKVAHHASL